MSVCTPAYLCCACLEQALAALDSLPWDCTDTAAIDAALGSTMNGCGRVTN